MIPTIKVTDNFGAFKAQFGKVGELQRRGLAVALNDAAFKSRPVISRELRDTFPTLTPFIERSPVVDRQRATPERLSVEVRVAQERDVGSESIPAQSVLRANTIGGPRRFTAFEKALQGVTDLKQVRAVCIK